MENQDQEQDQVNLVDPQLMDQLASGSDEGAQLIAILEELEATVSSARALPMSPLIMVNRAAVVELVQQARNAIPADVQAANSIVSGAQAVISRAKEEAETTLALAGEESERIVAEAHSEAERLVASERITVMAQERADQIIEEATAQAKALTSGADMYCDKQLADLEAEFDKYIRQARAGREVLASRASFDPQTMKAKTFDEVVAGGEEE